MVQAQYNTTCDHSYACITSLTQFDCSENDTFIEFDPITTQTCCPTCRGGIGRNVDGCENDNTDLLCAPGLRCESLSCVLDKGI